MKQCLMCNTSFAARHGNQKYCDDACRKVKAKTQAAYYYRSHRAACQYDGMVFVEPVDKHVVFRRLLAQSFLKDTP